MQRIPEASLKLPKAGYLKWLNDLPPYQMVGYRPAGSANPLSRYIQEFLGIAAVLQTDGERAWFLLSLDRDGLYHVRMVLPEWTVPLAARYTAHKTATYKSVPNHVEIQAYQALQDVEQLSKES